MITKQKRIAFACKMSKLDPKCGVVSIPEYNTQTTTLAWLNRQDKAKAYQRLESIVKHNLSSIRLLVQEISTWNPALRMVRLSSEILPAYTAPIWCEFYQSTTMQNYLQQEFASVGKLARDGDVRLSFHPGQFTVLASDRPQVVENSIQEFEYHADMARWMGYGVSFQDFKINVHISGKLGPSGIISVLPRLSLEARNCITIENEELTYGLDDCLTLSDYLPIVLDLHHHWVKAGEYIQPNDYRIAKIIDSWRGVRPVLHYSQSREDVLVNHPVDVAPNRGLLLESGFNKTKLRAHSDFFWNKKINDYALTFLDHFDIMCESKAKNLASIQLYEQIK
jgi:UV DNA damage repair endonuclease